MPPHGTELQTSCLACGATQPCGPTQMMQRLADIGMMKRSSDPDLDLLVELFRAVADRLPCHSCQAIGLTLSNIATDEWDDVRSCDRCHKPIPLERLDVFPDTTRCADCQRSSEDGSDQEREFCEQCGSVMSMRLRISAGPTAYEMKCPTCR